MARALAAIERLSETAVDDLRKMVAVDTSFPPGVGYDAFADLMAQLAAPLALDCERVIVPEELWRAPGARGRRTNLIARRRSGRPVLGLYFHVDTVPAAPGWSSDPLRLLREGDRLIGLGAADMKGSIAAALLALRAAQEAALPLAYDPMLLLCTDEEAGLYPGVRYLAEQGRLEGHILNFNGSAMPRIWAGCFGLFTLTVRVHGKAAHAGEQRSAGANAIEAALPILNALSALKPVIAQRISALPPPPHATGPLTASLDVSAIHGGQCGGQIPSQAEILLCRRYAPEEDFAVARTEIETAIKNAAGSLDVDMTLTGHLAPTADPGGPHWPRWQQALSAGFGYAPDAFARWGASGCSDFGWVQQATGMQEVLLTGLGKPDSCIHAPGESTTLTDIVALAKSVLAYLSVEFCPELSPETMTP
ncbi:hypothetical protein SSBR45G_11800 [Bradyrhizobium sp. SSBR45G]|nr:hypothetical protein SSBR45G_11800 [Bradyrhizobium sp. SSBR45G]GLH83245.1 hypothetical protein SSBR45R_07050 [Bradyrhizobium sp. SSBR45R]